MMTLSRFSDIDDVVERANSTPYGQKSISIVNTTRALHNEKGVPVNPHPLSYAINDAQGLPRVFSPAT